MPTYEKLDPAFKKRWDKIDPAFKKQWVKALRSGKYKQGSDALATGDPLSIESYCCLGVACDLIDSTAWISDDDSMFKRHYGWKGHGSGTTLNLSFVTGRVGEKLSRMNDAGMDFSEIADWIEENL
jgi:hypothetical protein